MKWLAFVIMAHIALVATSCGVVEVHSAGRGSSNDDFERQLAAGCNTHDECLALVTTAITRSEACKPGCEEGRENREKAVALADAVARRDAEATANKDRAQQAAAEETLRQHADQDCARQLASLAGVSERDRPAFQRACVTHFQTPWTPCRHALLPGGPWISCDDATTECATVLYLADYAGPGSAARLAGSMEPASRVGGSHKYGSIVGCGESRGRREAQRQELASRIDAILRERDEKDAWIKSHCKRSPNAIYSTQKELQVTPDDDLVYEHQVIAFSVPPFFCPKGTPSDLNEYALGSVGHSPFRRELAGLLKQQRLDQSCRAADDEVDRCRVLLAQPPEPPATGAADAGSVDTATSLSQQR